MARKLVVEIVGDTGNLERSLGRAGRRSETFGQRVKRGAGIAGVALGVGLAAAARAGFKEFMEGEKVAAQTNAVLKSTGGIANVTAKEVDRLAGSLMKKTGVDDEQIAAGENMLLTFTKIRNETGKGNDIFNQATKATLDLSVAMGKDMTDSAILVGKALNDPVAGLTALKRVGVSFGETQKELIKDLVEGRKAADNIAMTYQGPLSGAQIDQMVKLSKLGMGWREVADAIGIEFTPAQAKSMDFMEQGGHMMLAQKSILKELQTEFGGSAEAAGKTFAGQLNILRESFNNLMGEIVGSVMPGLLRLSQAMMTGVTWLQKNEQAAKALFVAMGVLTGALIAARAAQLLLNLAVLANPYVAVTALVVALGAAVVIAYQRSDRFREAVNELWAAIRNHPLVGLASALAEVSQKLVGAESNTDLFRKAIGLVWTLIRESPLGKMIELIGDLNAKVTAATEKAKGWGDALEPVVGFLRKIIDGIKWLIDHIPRLPKLPDINPFGGDVRDPRMTGPPVGPPGAGTGPGSISASLYDELGMAQRMGLTLTSGYRAPTAANNYGRTRSGTISDHSVFPSKAIDVAGSSSAMAGFFRWLIGQTDVKQAFYDPLGSIFGGGLSSYREGGHSDHVHVATYDRGGVVPGFGPKPAIVHGGETILPTHKSNGGLPMQVNLNVDGTMLAKILVDPLRREAQIFQRQNGRAAFS